MATNRKRKRMEVLEVSEKASAVEAPKQKEIIEEEVKNFLSADDFRLVETVYRDVDNYKLKIHVEEQALKNMYLELAILDLKIVKQRMTVKHASDSYENKKESYKKMVLGMIKKYNIDDNDRFSYDPETGEIKSEINRRFLNG